MKKRQTENTTAQRCPSPAERGHGGRGEPFTLELSVFQAPNGLLPLQRKKSPRFFCGNLGGTAEALCLRPLFYWDEGVFFILRRTAINLRYHLEFLKASLKREANNNVKNTKGYKSLS